MRTFVQLSFLVFAALAATPAASSAQVSYARAEQLLPWSTSMRVIGDAVDPGWYPDSSRFWYRNRTRKGVEFVLIDPARGTRGVVFDNARLARDDGRQRHVAAIKQLATRHRFIDVERVGIFGHSRGGFASTDAIFKYPDFFKVAVSGAGNHDNRSYNIYWAEKYQGFLTRDTIRKTDNFDASANATMAKNLKGKLLLMHGDMDDNVHPAMTIQVVDALIKANRTFDLIIASNRPHSLNEPYFIRRRWDYFVQHLMGATPPNEYEIVRPAGAVPADEAQQQAGPEEWMEAVTVWGDEGAGGW